MNENRCPRCHLNLNDQLHPGFGFCRVMGAPNKKRILVIFDEGHEDRRTVTTGVECVLAAVMAQYVNIDLDNYDIIYQDSRGVFDRILTRHSRFLGFQTLTSGPEITDVIQAIDKLKEIQIKGN